MYAHISTQLIIQMYQEYAHSDVSGKKKNVKKKKIKMKL